MSMLLLTYNSQRRYVQSTFGLMLCKPNTMLFLNITQTFTTLLVGASIVGYKWVFNVGFKDEGKNKNKVINLEDERVGNNFGVKGLILFDS